MKGGYNGHTARRVGAARMNTTEIGQPCPAAIRCEWERTHKDGCREGVRRGEERRNNQHCTRKVLTQKGQRVSEEGEMARDPLPPEG